MTNDERSTSSNDEIPEGTGVMDADKKPYDLEERTARFGETVIAFVKRIPHNVVTIPLIGQLVRSGTSVGANYCEADDAVSKKDFRHMISISQEGGPRVEVLASHDRRRRRHRKEGGKTALARGKGASLDLFRDLAKEIAFYVQTIRLLPVVRTTEPIRHSFVIRHSSFVIPSSFELRHFPACSTTT